MKVGIAASDDFIQVNINGSIGRTKLGQLIQSGELRISGYCANSTPLNAFWSIF